MAKTLKSTVDDSPASIFPADVWLNVIQPLLDHLDYVVLSVVSKKFYGHVKPTLSRGLCVIFIVKCKECGLFEPNHFCGHIHHFPFTVPCKVHSTTVFPFAVEDEYTISHYSTGLFIQKKNIHIGEHIDNRDQSVAITVSDGLKSDWHYPGNRNAQHIFFVQSGVKQVKVQSGDEATAILDWAFYWSDENENDVLCRVFNKSRD
jgi:hypothetical protein